MSLQPQPISAVPEETARVARAAFPKGNLYITLRDEIGTLYSDIDFAALYPTHGQPTVSPWRLALICVMQFIEDLSDRQAAEAVRSRIDWKYVLGLPLTDPGFNFSVLCEFRARLISGGAEQQLLDTLLQQFKERGWIKVRGKQRTDSTHVLATIRTSYRLETLGYLYFGELGIPGRHYFRRGMPRTHQIHLVKLNSEFWETHVLFRDFLRTHSNAAQQYEALKRDLAVKFRADRERYTDSKTPLIEQLLVQARAWRSTCSTVNLPRNNLK